MHINKQLANYEINCSIQIIPIFNTILFLFGFIISI